MKEGRKRERDREGESESERVDIVEKREKQSVRQGDEGQER